MCCDTNCQFQPSTVSCGVMSPTGVFQSYCHNGVCTASVCSSYTGLSYCGVTNGNGCQQSCLMNGVCTSSKSQKETLLEGIPGFHDLSFHFLWCLPHVALSSPSATARQMPDGTVCNTSPYSTCVSGSCVSSTAGSGTRWVASNPSVCSCAGSQTLTVQCEDANNNIVAATQCTGTKPASMQSCTPPTSCATWQALGFGTCSNNCGPGTQTQTVQCVQTSTGIVVANSMCSTATKPATSRTCTIAATCQTQWVQGGFGLCTKSCAGGTQTQSVQCYQTQNGVQTMVVASACTAPIPASIQACNTQACGSNIQWMYGVFSTCSAPVS
jgi:hypothetical protein